MTKPHPKPPPTIVSRWNCELIVVPVLYSYLQMWIRSSAATTAVRSAAPAAPQGLQSRVR
jgi:hypothetical protein